MNSQSSYIPIQTLETTASYNAARYAYATSLFAAASAVSTADEQTCCEDWCVADAVEHATLVMNMVDNIDGETTNDSTGIDPLTLAQKHAEWSISRWDQQSLAKPIQTPFGEMTVDDFLGIIWVDTLTHTWDITDASGLDHGIPQVMAEEAHNLMTLREVAMRGPGRFNPAVETNSDDAVDRFIAFTGRTSVRGSLNA